MSKKLTLSLLLCTLLAGCQLFETEKSAPSTISESEPTTISSESTPETEKTAPSAPRIMTLLNEQVGDSPYPIATLPPDVPADELNQAIEQYYNDNYSEEDKAANTTPVAKNVLRDLQTAFKKNEQTKKLNIHVEQITMTLNQQDIYVTRIVVPFSHEQANQQLAESEIILTNEALAYLGNRLVYVTYYDSHTKQLTPVNLSNNQYPLYYNGD